MQGCACSRQHHVSCLALYAPCCLDDQAWRQLWRCEIYLKLGLLSLMLPLSCCHLQSRQIMSKFVLGQGLNAKCLNAKFGRSAMLHLPGA